MFTYCFHTSQVPKLGLVFLYFAHISPQCPVVSINNSSSQAVGECAFSTKLHHCSSYQVTWTIVPAA